MLLGIHVACCLVPKFWAPNSGGKHRAGILAPSSLDAVAPHHKLPCGTELTWRVTLKLSWQLQSAGSMVMEDSSQIRWQKFIITWEIRDIAHKESQWITAAYWPKKETFYQLAGRSLWESVRITGSGYSNLVNLQSCHSQLRRRSLLFHTSCRIWLHVHHILGQL